MLFPSTIAAWKRAPPSKRRMEGSLARSAAAWSRTKEGLAIMERHLLQTSLHLVAEDGGRRVRILYMVKSGRRSAASSSDSSPSTGGIGSSSSMAVGSIYEAGLGLGFLCGRAAEAELNSEGSIDHRYGFNTSARGVFFF